MARWTGHDGGRGASVQVSAEQRRDQGRELGTDQRDGSSGDASSPRERLSQRLWGQPAPILWLNDPVSSTPVPGVAVYTEGWPDSRERASGPWPLLPGAPTSPRTGLDQLGNDSNGAALSPLGRLAHRVACHVGKAGEAHGGWAVKKVWWSQHFVLTL